MSLKLYSHSKCSTCRKALSFLQKNNIKFTNFDIIEQPPSKSELKRMLDEYDGNLKKLFNTSGELYRTMEISKKLPEMSSATAVTLLHAHGKLIKRPFLIGENQACVGFDPDQWDTLLGK